MQLIEAHPERILIVEEEGLLALDVQKRLKTLGYPFTVIAGSSVEALRCAQSAPLDLVFMDLRLEGGIGVAAGQALKSEFDSPVVYIAAHADRETVERTRSPEPFSYITKPITDGDLQTAVEISLYRARMERRVRVSEAWLSAILLSVGEGVIATNFAGEIVFMNPVAEKLTGWLEVAAHGRTLMEVLTLVEASTGEPDQNPLADLFTGPKQIDGVNRSYYLTCPDGSNISVELQVFENRPVAGMNELPGVIVVLRDVTNRRLMEDRVMQSQRMEAVANMAGGLAHDFNNQLTVIIGYAERLCNETHGALKCAALAIRQAAETSVSITRQLLALSRREPVHHEIVNANEVIGELAATIAYTLGCTRPVVTDLAALDGFVRGDRNQLKQVLLNLALNARDAMPEGGELRVESSNIEIEPDSRAALLYRPDRYWRLRVIDTGDGMDEVTQARIFEPFFTTKKIGFGTGLGLSTVHSIIARSGGYVSVESRIGHGTAFEILLPVFVLSR